MGGSSFDPKEIWVSPQIDEEAEVIDIKLWHPQWEGISERDRWKVIFLFLDEALGEYGTEWWLGVIQATQEPLEDSFPLEELAGYVGEISEQYGWKKSPPGEAHTLFTIEKPPGKYPRSDLLTQSTAAPKLFRQYMKANGELEDPLTESGADYVYISIPRSHFPAGEEVDKRSKIEDRIDAALKAQKSGRCLGGGSGSGNGYVDFLIFDGDRSIKIICETLKSLELEKGSMIEYFAKEKRDHRIAL